MLHHIRQTLGQIDIAQEPNDAVEQQILHRRVEIELHLSRDPIVETIDRTVERAHAVTVAHGGKGRGDGGGCGSGLIGDAHDE